VTSNRYGQLIAHVYSAASGADHGPVTSVPCEAAKQLRPRFVMAGTHANVWPLSPQDWSTG
jgi:hypothetical protein